MAITTIDGLLTAFENIETRFTTLASAVSAVVLTSDAASTFLLDVRDIATDLNTMLDDLAALDPTALLNIESARNLLAIWTLETTFRSQLMALLFQTSRLESLLTQLVQGVEERLVVVRENETLQSIAARELGDWREWTRIIARNPGLSPVTITSGTTIVIPAEVT